MLAAAATVAVFAGVAGPAAPAITLVVWQAGAVDRCAYLAAVGMFTTTTTPILAQVGHWKQGERGWTRWQEGSVAALFTSPASCLPVHVRPSPS